MQKTIEVPLAVLIEVSNIILDRDLTHEITATDETEETITLEVSYEKDERESIHEIEDLVEDYLDEEEE